MERGHPPIEELFQVKLAVFQDSDLAGAIQLSVDLNDRELRSAIEISPSVTGDLLLSQVDDIRERPNECRPLKRPRLNSQRSVNIHYLYHLYCLIHFFSFVNQVKLRIRPRNSACHLRMDILVCSGRTC